MVWLVSESRGGRVPARAVSGITPERTNSYGSILLSAESSKEKSQTRRVRFNDAESSSADIAAKSLFTFQPADGPRSEGKDRAELTSPNFRSFLLRSPGVRHMQLAGEFGSDLSSGFGLALPAGSRTPHQHPFALSYSDFFKSVIPFSAYDSAYLSQHREEYIYDVSLSLVTVHSTSCCADRFFVSLFTAQDALLPESGTHDVSGLANCVFLLAALHANIPISEVVVPGCYQCFL